MRSAEPRGSTATGHDCSPMLNVPEVGTIQPPSMAYSIVEEEIRADVVLAWEKLNENAKPAVEVDSPSVKARLRHPGCHIVKRCIV